MNNFTYRKKPVTVEAFQLKTMGSPHTVAIPGWIMEAIKSGKLEIKDYATYIHTLEGALTVSEDDWIIRGVQGEIYPCKPDIFEATYEKV